jgi:hypothetical protein
MIIRVFRPVIHPGKEQEYEEHLLADTWIGHYEVLPAPILEPVARRDGGG